jgi:Fe-S cluster assembly protein SufD
MNAETLLKFQNDHLLHYKAKGFKETTQDSYKFTNLKSFFPETFDASTSKSSAPDFPSQMPTISFINGAYSDSNDLPSGVHVKKLKDHFSEVVHLFKDSNALSHLHHSLIGEGVIIEIAKKADISTPIRILNILTSSMVSAPTNIIVANALSRITIFEETRGLDVSHAVVSETYIAAHEGSNVEHIVIDQESEAGINHGSVFSEVAKDATVKSFIFHGAGKLNRTNLTLNLNAPGSNGESYSLYLTQGEEHSDINTVINHRSADTTSSQIAKGILDGSSKGVFTGKIHIHPKAQRVASSQLNKNLLISKKAQVHSQPQLEIFADDVKCSHGSTTGQLSDDEVFYLETRGIPADKARSILALGFGFEIVQKIGNQIAREHVSGIIRENLETKFKLGGGL